MFESLFIQLDCRMSKTKDIILDVIYKPPDVDTDLLTSLFGEVLKLSKRKQHVLYTFG